MRERKRERERERERESQSRASALLAASNVSPFKDVPVTKMTLNVKFFSTSFSHITI